jgi:RNA polymerase sigma-70 factor, ECF subfamily
MIESIDTIEDKSKYGDELLIKGAQSDPEAFKPLYEKYFKKIFLFIFHRVGDKELSADLSQQTFLKALKNLNKFQLRGLPFSAWLYRIAINETNDYFRKVKRSRVVMLDDSIAETLFEEITGNDRLEEFSLRLPAILQLLKPDDLQLIELRFFEQKSFREIGILLDITETHAKVKTYRAIDKMKKQLVYK